jgi:TatA/E family protein of Tat protein translocase
MLFEFFMTNSGSPLAFIDGLGGMEMLLIFVVALLLFGGEKLPEFARNIGKMMREFKKAASGVEEEFKRAMEEDERKRATPAIEASTTTPAQPTTPDATNHGYPEDGSTDYSYDGSSSSPAGTAEATTASTTAATDSATATSPGGVEPTKVESAAPAVEAPPPAPKPKPVVNEDYP